MRILVTGVAGFIGSALARRLLERGNTVRGIDSFLDSYPRELKEDRLRTLLAYGEFTFVENDLAACDVDSLTSGIDIIYHLAAQAGVRSSWGKRFEVYTSSNIIATQRLLEAAKDRKLSRFFYASSSSVYGNSELMPTPEEAPLKPVSPYAVTKLAGEHLCNLYHGNFGVPTIILRFFTVYGPKPRPDQAVCIFTRALMEGREIQVFGDGEQLRGMTYVEDVVDATILAAEGPYVGDVFNIGGGTSISVNQLVSCLEHITKKQAQIKYVPEVRGDAKHTLADISKAKSMLGWHPKTDTAQGLEQTVASISAFYYLAD